MFALYPFLIHLQPERQQKNYYQGRRIVALLVFVCVCVCVCVCVRLYVPEDLKFCNPTLRSCCD